MFSYVSNAKPFNIPFDNSPIIIQAMLVPSTKMPSNKCSVEISFNFI